MKNWHSTRRIGVVGAGAMGQGIAQIFASHEWEVCLVDSSESALHKAQENHKYSLYKFAEKSQISEVEIERFLSRIHYTDDLKSLKTADIVVEAIVEDYEAKKLLFNTLESIVSEECLLATNTSSFTITGLASACKHSERFIGIHFFNPVTRMPLVEIIPALQTDTNWIPQIESVLHQMGKVPVVCQDTPGFLVNRIARPFYGEAIRIWEEGLASMDTIDFVMKEQGGFKMGPFELMDFIGHDVNFRVTESVYESLFYNPKYMPSITQKKLFLAGHYGRKSGIGFRQYPSNTLHPGLKNQDEENKARGKYEKEPQILFERILFMLINEAADAFYYKLGSKEAIDLAMMKGANYPMGLLKWADQLDLKTVVETLDNYQNFYRDGRYKVSPIRREMRITGEKFYAE